jgi:hypothetical protein
MPSSLEKGDVEQPSGQKEPLALTVSLPSQSAFERYRHSGLPMT